MAEVNAFVGVRLGERAKDIDFEWR
jgi:hypothetical protein